MKLNSKQKSSAVNASVTYEHDNLQPLKTKVSIYCSKEEFGVSHIVPASHTNKTMKRKIGEWI